MKYPIFLFGSGRCGSTLFQRVLNTHEGIVMYGEHEGFLAPLANSYRLLTRSKNVRRYVYGAGRVDPEVVRNGLSDLELDICWVNSFSEPQVRSAFRRLVLNVLAEGLDLESIHWGFKEIRYRDGQHALGFLRELFPECRMIFVFRHPISMVASAISAWRGPELREAEDRGEGAEFVRRVAPEHYSGWFRKNGHLFNQASSANHHSLIMNYEQLVNQPEQSLNRLFGFLEMEVPAAALDVIGTKVASTEKSAHKAMVNRIVEELYPQQPADLLRLADQLGYHS